MRRAYGVLAAALLVPAGVVTPVLGAGTSSASADPPASTTVRWEMNESAGTTVMNDSGPNDLDGVVDPTGVDSAFTFDGATGYHWERRPPEVFPASPERIVTVADDAVLDAGEGFFTLEIRYRTKENFGNIIQKGQATTPGGQWKVQAPQGIPSCLFKGSQGRVATGAKTPINDNQWHVLTCVKTPTSVTLFVDGEQRNKKNGVIGLMDNTKPVTIGGKLDCVEGVSTCDYFSGDIDYVRITKTLPGPVVSAQITPSKLEIGERFTVAGSVVDGATGNPLSGRPISLFGRPKGGSSFVTEGVRATSDVDGTFAFTFRPVATTEWYVSTGGVDSVVTKVGVDGRISLHLDDSTVRRGTPVEFFGTVRPKSATLVELQRKQPSGWVTKRSTTPADGDYSITWKPKSTKDYAWRTRVSAPTFAPDVSPTRTLTVKKKK